MLSNYSNFAPNKKEIRKESVFQNKGELQSLSSDGYKGKESKFKTLSKVIISPRIVFNDLENSSIEQRNSNSKLISSNSNSRSGSKSNNFQIPMELVESYKDGQPVSGIK